MAREVRCETHGAARGCMICRHLCEGTMLGFYRVEVPPGSDDYETALCEKCDALVWSENGWTDKVYEHAGWKLYCVYCYEDVLRRHRQVGIGQLRGEA